jgi:hypothetical protein
MNESSSSSVLIDFPSSIKYSYPNDEDLMGQKSMTFSETGNQSPPETIPEFQVVDCLIEEFLQALMTDPDIKSKIDTVLQLQIEEVFIGYRKLIWAGKSSFVTELCDIALKSIIQNILSSNSSKMEDHGMLDRLIAQLRSQPEVVIPVRKNLIYLIAKSKKTIQSIWV